MQFRSDVLVGQVHAALRQAELPAAHLELELTENLLMEDTESAMSMLAALRQLGVSLAIDDFGTGFSSLSYLKRLPVGTLKVDRSFVKDLAPGSGDSAIVSAVIAMAHSLGLKVVAEGVDDGRQLDILRAQACDEIQGFLFAKPMPLPEFRDWLATIAPAPRYRSASPEPRQWSCGVVGPSGPCFRVGRERAAAARRRPGRPAAWQSCSS